MIRIVFKMYEIVFWKSENETVYNIKNPSFLIFNLEKMTKFVN